LPVDDAVDRLAEIRTMIRDTVMAMPSRADALDRIAQAPAKDPASA
jgi:hypothetical protein